MTPESSASCGRMPRPHSKIANVMVDGRRTDIFEKICWNGSALASNVSSRDYESGVKSISYLLGGDHTVLLSLGIPQLVRRWRKVLRSYGLQHGDIPALVTSPTKTQILDPVWITLKYVRATILKLGNVQQPRRCSVAGCTHRGVCSTHFPGLVFGKNNAGRNLLELRMRGHLATYDFPRSVARSEINTHVTSRATDALLALAKIPPSMIRVTATPMTIELRNARAWVADSSSDALQVFTSNLHKRRFLGSRIGLRVPNDSSLGDMATRLTSERRPEVRHLLQLVLGHLLLKDLRKNKDWHEATIQGSKISPDFQAALRALGLVLSPDLLLCASSLGAEDTVQAARLARQQCSPHMAQVMQGYTHVFDVSRAAPLLRGASSSKGLPVPILNGERTDYAYVFDQLCGHDWNRCTFTGKLSHLVGDHKFRLTRWLHRKVYSNSQLSTVGDQLNPKAGEP